MSYWLGGTLVLLCAITCMHASSVPGATYVVRKTCQHTYGQTLYTLNNIPSATVCALQCDRMDTCLSAMHNAGASTCTLNDDTAIVGDLPLNHCGFSYMEHKGNDTGLINGTCHDSNDCVVNGTVCVGWQCTCDTDLAYDHVTDVCTTPPGQINGRCSISIDCIVNGSVCVSEVCVCDSGLTFDNLTDVCTVPPGQINGGCSMSTDCIVNGSVCVSGVCVCDSGLTFDNLTDVCASQSQIGGNCSISTNCSIAGSVCVNDICVCNNGLDYDSIQNVCTSALNQDCGIYCFPAPIVSNAYDNDATTIRINMECNITFPNTSMPAGTLRIAVLTDVPATTEPYNSGSVTYISHTETIFTNEFNENSPYMFGWQTVYTGQITHYNNSVPVTDVDPPVAQCRIMF